MTLKRITDADIAGLGVSSLPSRPTAPRSFGGAGYTAKEMKAAFDRLPLFIISRLNLLIEAIGTAGEEGVSALIPSGVRDGQSLRDLLLDVTSGELADYLYVLGTPLSEAIASLRSDVTKLESGASHSAGELGGTLNKIEALEALIEDARIEDARLGTELSTLRAATDAAVATLSDRCEDTDESVAALEERIALISSEVKSLDSGLGTLGASLTSLGEEIYAEIESLRTGVGDGDNIIIDCGGPEGLL